MERKTCRWCKYYKNGCCTNQNILNLDKISPVITAVENGETFEAIQEGFGDMSYNELITLLKSYKLSTAKIDKVIDCIEGIIYNLKIKWAHNIDDNIATLFMGKQSAIEECYIKEPNTFYCKYFE